MAGVHWRGEKNMFCSKCGANIPDGTAFALNVVTNVKHHPEHV